MRKIPVFLVLILIVLWLYTSWYWYTCKIKWFCSIGKVTPTTQEQQDTPDTQDTVAPAAVSEAQPVETTPVVVEEVSEPQSEPVVVAELDPEPVICDDILSKAISLWGNNNQEEVEKLETFLNESEWESLDVDGRYGQDDFDAVKRFQVKHRSEILDPWDISNPTWYVYTTTIKKINEIHCNN